MTYFEHHAVQAGVLFAGLMIAAIFLLWTISRSKESYVDRYKMLVFSIEQAYNGQQLMDLAEACDQFFDEFYEQQPMRITQLVANLNRLLNTRASVVADDVLMVS